MLRLERRILTVWTVQVLSHTVAFGMCIHTCRQTQTKLMILIKIEEPFIAYGCDEAYSLFMEVRPIFFCIELIACCGTSSS